MSEDIGHRRPPRRATVRNAVRSLTSAHPSGHTHRIYTQKMDNKRARDDSEDASATPKADQQHTMDNTPKQKWRKVNGHWELPHVSKAESAEAKRLLKKEGISAFLERFLPEAPQCADMLYVTLLLGFFPLSMDEDINDPKNMARTIKMLQKAINKAMYTRSRNPEFTTPEKAISAIMNAKKVLVLTGAGISTSLGIPDFRSARGIYSLVEGLNLDDPQQVFDLETFRTDPDIFYQVAHMVLPPDNIWTPTHAFIKALSDKGKLLRNYTQNIDNIEATVGIPADKFIQCHGSFATATCRTCKKSFEGSRLYPIIREKKLPVCPKCKPGRDARLENDEYIGDHGILKPDITFFGEDLPKKFDDNVKNDVRECDLVICIGTSLKVSPVNNIVNMVPESVPQILINKDDITHAEFDLTLLGYCDEVVTYLSDKLGWELKHEQVPVIKDSGLYLETEDAEAGVYNIDAKQRVTEKNEASETKEQGTTA